ncbi:hypothetical protein [Streptomyces mirabilis]|uniref:hypothetical protein n=1 Tax=Streptomyces mirabilis TaxID=68239 RepID=UPI002E2CEFA7|nr:hypothetical protein [Streptomyces mirabilis]
MTQRNTSLGRRRKAINVLAAVLASVVACGGVVWVAQGLDWRVIRTRWWTRRQRRSGWTATVPGVVDVDK